MKNEQPGEELIKKHGQACSHASTMPPKTTSGDHVSGDHTMYMDSSA